MAVNSRLSDNDAQEIVAAAERCREGGRLDPTEFPAEELAQAGATILRALRRQALELERERGRSYRDDAPRVQGAWLGDGHDDGGRRHYLRGEPVHCGDGVYLLTFNGWMAGRYERSANHATFWFSVPGVRAESVIAIQPDMLFAWPHEVQRLRPQLSKGPFVAGV